MSSEQWVDFYFSNYTLELETRSAIDNRIGFSVGVAVVVVAIPAFYLLNYVPGDDPKLEYGFWSLAVLATASLIMAFVLLGLAIWSSEFKSYKILGPFNAVDEYRLGFGEWSRNDPNAPNPDGAFAGYLLEDLARAAAHNQNLNVKRSLRWFKGTGWMLVAVGLYAAAAVPFFMMRGLGPSEISTQSMEISMPEEKPQEPTPSNPPDDNSGNPVPRPPLRDTASEDPPSRPMRIPEEHKEVRGS